MPTLLITGSNRGIGLELARQYAAGNWEVIATCRNPEKAKALQDLRAQYPDAIEIRELDVTEQNAIDALAREFSENGRRIDLLICNAGALNARPYGAWQMHRFLNTVAVNAIAPGMLVQAFDPTLTSAAKVIFISSAIGSLSQPLKLEDPPDAYAVSKAAMNMMAIRTAAKLRSKSIPLAAISPGWVRTDMGGSEAKLSVEESVASLRTTIAKVDMEQSGSFLDRFGQNLPW